MPPFMGADLSASLSCFHSSISKNSSGTWFVAKVRISD